MSAPSASTSTTSPPITLEYPSANNTLCKLVLRVGDRVRVEVDPSAPTAAAAQISTEDELSRTAKATVRYIGPVAAAKDPLAMMVGIEWDDQGRGKNDGAVGGKRYFTCTSGQGSFLHPARVVFSPQNASLAGAVAEKYETRFQKDLAATNASNNYLVAEQKKMREKIAVKSPVATDGTAAASSSSPPPADAAAAGPRHIPIVFQGEEYMQGRIAEKLHALIDMTLTQSDISRAYPPDTQEEEEEAKLRAKLSNCQTIDLTNNLLADWKELSKLTKCLKKLNLIAISDNNLQYSTLFSAEDSKQLCSIFTTSFSHIGVFVLNRVPLAFDSILTIALAGGLPELTELHLCKNNMSSFREIVKRVRPDVYSAESTVPTKQERELLATAFPNLQILEISFNAFSSWRNELAIWQDLAKLERLLVNSNKLEEIRYGEEESNAPVASVPSSSSSSSAASSSSSRVPWSALQSLSLNSNRLSSFSTSVSALQRFPVLNELRLRENPALEEETMKLNSGSGNMEDPIKAEMKKLLEADEARKIIQDSVSSALLAIAANAAAASSSSSSSAASTFLSTPQSASLLRLQLIARLPAVTTLNRSRITPRERMDAEKYYLLSAFQHKHQMKEEDFAVAFERYSTLVTEHGDPAATFSAMSKQMMEPTGSTLASKLVEVHLVLAEAAPVSDPSSSSSSSSSTDGFSLSNLNIIQHQIKKLSSSLTTQSCRTLMEKMFKIPAHEKALYSLVYRESKLDAASHALTDALKLLQYYGIVSGACIILMKQQK